MTFASADVPWSFFRLTLLCDLIWGQGFGKVPEVIFFYFLDLPCIRHFYYLWFREFWRVFLNCIFFPIVLFKCQLKSSEKNLHSCTLLHVWECDVHHDQCQVEEPLSMPSRSQSIAETWWEAPCSSTSAGSHGTAAPKPVCMVAECSLAALSLLSRVDEADDQLMRDTQKTFTARGGGPQHC